MSGEDRLGSTYSFVHSITPTSLCSLSLFASRLDEMRVPLKHYRSRSTAGVRKLLLQVVDCVAYLHSVVCSCSCYALLGPLSLVNLLPVGPSLRGRAVCIFAASCWACPAGHE
jgi:hypothetical protein